MDVCPVKVNRSDPAKSQVWRLTSVSDARILTHWRRLGSSADRGHYSGGDEYEIEAAGRLPLLCLADLRVVRDYGIWARPSAQSRSETEYVWQSSRTGSHLPPHGIPLAGRAAGADGCALRPRVGPRRSFKRLSATSEMRRQ